MVTSPSHSVGQPLKGDLWLTPTKFIIEFIKMFDLKNKYNNAHTLTLLLPQFIVHITIRMRDNIYSYNLVYFNQQGLRCYGL